jgi:hypothetical protein
MLSSSVREVRVARDLPVRRVVLGVTPDLQIILALVAVAVVDALPQPLSPSLLWVVLAVAAQGLLMPRLVLLALELLVP